ncbi:family 3 glycoside hydrolase [Coniochaeta ligniaria NRRL 30616]|uniref:beta-glucosidase n=1 Tax=Coniochaeta ligniaria NRRL 30616 TaxID=1408157 RepID=A0A1J7IUY7_9PEZI|nr:family 3 glycoside hydrolase [Coniochaeta ligniaria NRRL 30616]
MVAIVDTEAILRSLTLEEKVSLLAGGSFWETVAIPEKGIPSIKTTDGPNGTRGEDFNGNSSAACFPAATSIAATFDPEIARAVGSALAQEARSKGASCLLAPTVCIHRHPLGGRNFESYSEDPFLTGKLAASMIRGVQELGVAATIKHFVANEQETDRMSVDETIGERALREIYLRPFEMAIAEAGPWALMTAYNKVNGEHCDVSEWLLTKVLREEWGWDGLVMSDWGGTNSLAGIKAGLELEMPGPARVRKPDVVLEAIRRGEVQEKDVDERVRTILRFLVNLKAFENPGGPTPERAIDRPEHRKLIRDAGARGIVLLKNDNQILPLSLDKVRGKKVALIGFAKDALAHGGGSAAVNAHYKITPWDAFQNAYVGGNVEFTYAKGVRKERLLAPLGKNDQRGTVVGLDGQPGFTLSFYDPLNPTSSPTATKHGYETSAYSPLGSQESLWKVLELTGDFTPAETGNHCLAGSGIGKTEVFIDEELVIRQEGNFSDPMGVLFNAQTETEIRHPFIAGRTHRLRIRSYPPRNVGLEILEGRTGFRMGLALASDADADDQGEAVRLAREADYAVVFTGHDPQWETEGRDQESFHLPRRGSQDALVSAVAAANRNTVVVNSTGVAVAMPWLDDVAGLLQTWFPGQECGNSIVDVLTGSVCPEGHLPATFPRRIEDAPAYGNFPGTYDDGGQLKVAYAEGVFVGYRHYDRLSKDKVNFPFGFGLSYTSFSLEDMEVSRGTKDTFTVACKVSNTGKVAGGVAVQVYVGRAQQRVEHPVKCLVAFHKVRLPVGGARTASMLFTAKDFAYFDEARYSWVVDAGRYDVLLGKSAADIAQIVSVQVEHEIIYTP